MAELLRQIAERVEGIEIGASGADDLSGEAVPYYRSDRVLRDQILLCLRRVIDPDLHQDIVACNFVKKLKYEYDIGLVSFTLELTTPACPMKESFVDDCTRHLKELDWVKDVVIEVGAQAPKSFAGDAEKNLKEVGFIVAVSSCKGGVGKSSIAVNLAYMLKRNGASVGIVDVDVYGPSLNTLLPLENKQIYFTPSTEASGPAKEVLRAGEGSLIPLEYDGIKLMSYSYFRPDAEAFAAVRGPLASSLAYQMVTQTAWGQIDYLLIDMPPGTGDIHLTLGQAVKITGAVVVTTPQQLSLIDVEKGIHFYQKMNIPTVALVENMAYIQCPKCKEEQPIFTSTYSLALTPAAETEKKCNASVCSDKENCCQAKKPPGAKSKLSDLIEQFGVGTTLRLPLDPALSAVRFEDPTTGKIDFPFAKVFDDGNESWSKLKTFTQNLTRELSSVTYGSDLIPDVTTTSDGFIQIDVPRGSQEHTLHFVQMRDARLACKCAECVDEISHEALLKPRQVPVDVHVRSMQQANNYAVKIEWSDGHSSLMSFKSLIAIGTSRPPAAAGSCALGDEELEW